VWAQIFFLEFSLQRPRVSELRFEHFPTGSIIQRFDSKGTDGGNTNETLISMKFQENDLLCRHVSSGLTEINTASLLPSE